jgi:hypothetical protein
MDAGTYWETYRLLLLSAEQSRWTRPTPWFGSYVNSPAVLRIRIRMVLGLLDPDPDPLVRGMDPDPLVRGAGSGLLYHLAKKGKL